ncbi:MAG: tRNA (5-methylaminomethyl-2-thiouridine)(34)-methyltransferase MnmD [Pseudomonadota bacterium]
MRHMPLMPSDDTNAKLRWEAGDLPVSERFDDPYYSRADGLAESRHVFLDGNALRNRLMTASQPFHIAELGFGTGLNMVASVALWQEIGCPVPLRLTSFEKYPLSAPQMERSLSRWPELASIAQTLFDAWPSPEVRFGSSTLEVIVGDISETLPDWDATVDAWFLDGFAPSRNPQMWTEAVLENVGRCTASQGTFATYSAAGAVRRRLQAVGFEVVKRPGFGSKREMLTGRKP